jgi:hypothetical protein
VGVQILATGLIAELIVHLAAAQAPYVVRRKLEHVAAASSSQSPSKMPREIAS